MSNKVSIYVPDELLAEINRMRRARDPIPSMSTVAVGLMWDGLPSDSQLRIRRERRAEDLRDDDLS